MALKQSAAFVPAAPVLFRRHTSLPLTSPTRPSFSAPPARMQLGKILRAMFGGGESAPTEPGKHAVLGTPVAVPALAEPPLQTATFGLGCFWGAERKFWQTPGVYSTSVGYAAGATENPTYSEVCSGRSGHAEVVNVVFDPAKTSYEKLLDVFWEAHDPTTKNRQGNDVGTQYRSIILYYNEEQKKAAMETKAHYTTLLKKQSLGEVVTDIEPEQTYYLAEDYHQQYLQKNPLGYCGLGGLGVYVPPVRAAAE